MHVPRRKVSADDASKAAPFSTPVCAPVRALQQTPVPRSSLQRALCLSYLSNLAGGDGHYPSPVGVIDAGAQQRGRHLLLANVLGCPYLVDGNGAAESKAIRERWSHLHAEAPAADTALARPPPPLPHLRRLDLDGRARRRPRVLHRVREGATAC